MSRTLNRASARTAGDFGFAVDPVPAAPVHLPSPSFPAAGPFEAWTDGSCRPNPGPGGWAAVLRSADGQTLRLSGAEMDTTNNRMELRAAIAALEALPLSSRVVLFTDSEYVQKGITEWVPGWVRRGWITAKGKPVENRDLWEALIAAAAPHDVTWQWVRGHADNTMNVHVDALANAARERMVAASVASR
jgi:ribonuclease HI